MTDHLILYGDGHHDDSAAIRHLFNGGSVWDRRTHTRITAAGMTELPWGSYRLVPPKN